MTSEVDVWVAPFQRDAVNDTDTKSDITNSVGVSAGLTPGKKEHFCITIALVEHVAWSQAPFCVELVDFQLMARSTMDALAPSFLSIHTPLVDDTVACIRLYKSTLGHSTAQPGGCRSGCAHWRCRDYRNTLSVPHQLCVGPGHSHTRSGCLSTKAR